MQYCLFTFYYFRSYNKNKGGSQTGNSWSDATTTKKHFSRILVFININFNQRPRKRLISHQIRNKIPICDATTNDCRPKTTVKYKNKADVRQQLDYGSFRCRTNGNRSRRSCHNTQRHNTNRSRSAVFSITTSKLTVCWGENEVPVQGGARLREEEDRRRENQKEISRQGSGMLTKKLLVMSWHIFVIYQ